MIQSCEHAVAVMCVCGGGGACLPGLSTGDSVNDCLAVPRVRKTFTLYTYRLHHDMVCCFCPAKLLQRGKLDQHWQCDPLVSDFDCSAARLR